MLLFIALAILNFCCEAQKINMDTCKNVKYLKEFLIEKDSFLFVDSSFSLNLEPLESSISPVFKHSFFEAIKDFLIELNICIDLNITLFWPRRMSILPEESAMILFQRNFAAYFFYNGISQKQIQLKFNYNHRHSLTDVYLLDNEGGRYRVFIKKCKN